MSEVTVAIPVRDGGTTLAQTLHALARQTVEHELLVCDSGSRDGSAKLARDHGARVIEIAPAVFAHGGTRNLLLAHARGRYVALLTQDAEPADERWLESLVSGFALADDVAIVFGPYRPRAGASLPVRVELEDWFRSLSPAGGPAIERLAPEERSLAAIELVGRRGFFTDANACIARAAWERIPFREVAYAEDRLLAIDMLRAGYAKAFVPAAAVVHSHEYTPLQELRRGFDEWRALREVYGWHEPARPRAIARKLRGEVGAIRRAEPQAFASSRATLAAVILRQTARLAGALLGSRADRLPGTVRKLLSLERRGGFEPIDWSATAQRPRGSR